VEMSGLLGHGLLDGPDKNERFESLLAFCLFMFVFRLRPCLVKEVNFRESKYFKFDQIYIIR
jgi:hypothetical protein